LATVEFSSYFGAFEPASAASSEVSMDEALQWAFLRHSDTIFSHLLLPVHFQIKVLIDSSRLIATLSVSSGPGSEALVVTVPFPAQPSLSSTFPLMYAKLIV
jgi:hypothetical protein